MLLTEMNKYLNQEGRITMTALSNRPSIKLIFNIRTINAKVEDDKFYVEIAPVAGEGTTWVNHTDIFWADEELNPSTKMDAPTFSEADPTIGAPESLEKGE